MGKKSKWIAWVLAALLLALLAFVAAGPYLAMNGIRNVVASGEYGQLWRFVDFERLRESVRPQVQDRIVRGLMERLGPSGTAQTVGGVTSVIAEPAIDAIVSPAGIALLMHGSALASRLSGERSAGSDAGPADPLHDAKTRWESPSLFTATVRNADGKPVVFEFRRDGLSWKLAGLRLPD
jgi:hypothetical protein